MIKAELLSLPPATIQVKRLMTDPPELCCHISHALMEDPVVAQDGQTYERDCIEGADPKDSTHSDVETRIS